MGDDTSQHVLDTGGLQIGEIKISTVVTPSKFGRDNMPIGAGPLFKKPDGGLLWFSRIRKGPELGKWEEIINIEKANRYTGIMYHNNVIMGRNIS